MNEEPHKKWIAVETERFHLGEISTYDPADSIAKSNNFIFNLMQQVALAVETATGGVTSLRWVNIRDSQRNPNGELGFVRVICHNSPHPKAVRHTGEGPRTLPLAITVRNL